FSTLREAASRSPVPKPPKRYLISHIDVVEGLILTTAARLVKSTVQSDPIEKTRSKKGTPTFRSTKLFGPNLWLSHPHPSQQLTPDHKPSRDVRHRPSRRHLGR